MNFFLPLAVQNTFVFGQHILFVITSLLNVIALVCLLKQTPPNQAPIRNYLIYIQVSLIILDVFIDFLTTPIPLFPALGGYCVGLLCQVGLSPKTIIGVAILILTNIAVAIAICVLFKHQHLLLPSSTLKLSDRCLLVIRTTLFSLFISAPLVYIAIPDDREEIDLVIDQHPYNVSWIRQRGSYYFQRRTPIVVLLVYSVMLTFFSFSLFISTLFFHMFYVLKRKVDSSARSSNLRRSINILFAQLVIPLTVMVFPCVVIFTAIAAETWFSFEICLSMYYLLTLHSTVHNILLLSVTPAYRRFLLSLLSCRLKAPFWDNRIGGSSMGDYRRQSDKKATTTQQSGLHGSLKRLQK